MIRPSAHKAKSDKEQAVFYTLQSFSMLHIQSSLFSVNFYKLLDYLYLSDTDLKNILY